MHFFQRCSVFFALTEILVIIINFVGTLRELVLEGLILFSYGYFWKVAIPLAILIAIVCLIVAIFLYKGAMNKNEKHFLPWLIVHGIISGLATIGCFIVLFHPALPSALFKVVAIMTCILWGKWIIVSKCRNIIKNEGFDSQNGFKKLNEKELI